ncbi:MAG TPA: hypothetical protein VD968_08035 [Pyrinomonadaceae bacterium]|nr:hypothetical protein [Pyrinomonadaceae bacterium]
MKYLLVLGLLALVVGLIYWRLRPYIQMVRRFLGAVREANRVREAARGDLPRQPTRRASHADRLVRCASCGTWLPASRAVRLGSANTTFCSHACLERSADAPRKARKSAS